MQEITEDFVRSLDDELTKKGLKLHQRPFHVATAWMREHNYCGDIFTDKVWVPLKQIYAKMYPSGDFSIPPLMTTGVIIRDQVYEVKVPIIYGNVQIEPLKLIDISIEELEYLFKNYPDQGWEAIYSACDAIDFAYGVQELENTPLLKLSQNQISASFRIIKDSADIDASIQSSCLAVELAMKAFLTINGCTEIELKKLSHNLLEMANRVIKIKSNKNDQLLLSLISSFPNYVNSRYNESTLTRKEILDLAHKSQFIVAEITRRLTGRNIESLATSQPDSPPRRF